MGIKGRVRQWLGFSADAETPPRPIAEVILQMNSMGLLPRVGRAEALSVSAVLRARNLICSTATLPLIQRDASLNRVRLPLLEQIDPDVPNVVTLAQTLEDLLFEGLSWWRVLALGADGYPTYAQHLAFESVAIVPRKGWTAPLPAGYDPRDADIYVNGELIHDPAGELIRFDSPNPGLLAAGGRTVRRAVLLDTTSALYADNPRPLDFFTPTEGADPADDTAIIAALDAWNRARKERSTAYIPMALEYNSVDTPTPADLQLIELQRKATLDIANATGLDPEDLGISTTSRTYQNGVDRRQDRINDTYSPYMAAITHRLSMGDVTKRGRTVAFDLDDYLRADPKTRAEVYHYGITDGWLDRDEARAEEGRPALTAAQRAELQPAPAPAAGNVVPIDRARQRAANLGADDADMLVFAVDAMPPLTVDAERRIIEGIVVPYGPDKIARKNGYRWRFQQGSLVPPKELKRNKALRDHDNAQPLGYLAHFEDRPDGMFARYKITPGPDGDRALAEADPDNAIRDGLSAGVEINKADPDPLNQGVYLVAVGGAVWRETSVLAVPAFDDARVTRVAAGADKGEIMADPVTTDAPGTGAADPTPPPAAPDPAAVQLSNEQLANLVRQPELVRALMGVPAPAAPAQPEAAQFALTTQQVTALLAAPGGREALLGLPAPTPPETRDRVDPTRRATAAARVREAMPYRIDRRGNLTSGPLYDFSRDVIAGFRDQNGEALQRATVFAREAFGADAGPEWTPTHQFDTDMADAATLNPNRNRPDLYVDQKTFQYPIWDTINKGNLPDMTPFVLPKFNSSSGMVAAHVEGTEPSLGTFTATSQTITPSALSGKVSITREAWDQGGNPMLSGLIWTQMVRAWYEGLEAAAVTLLDGISPTSITVPIASRDDALTSYLEGEFAKLQFVRGGFRMRDWFVQADLYNSLVGATDGNGRKLIPVLGPTNATGTTSDFYGDISMAGLRGRPAWALAASGTVAANSYLFDRADVSGWASAPQRLTFENVEVRYVHVGIWGYKATAVTDTTGVRRVIYDPV